jgi:hypothetical protein
LRWSGNGDFQGTAAVGLLKGSAFPGDGGTEWPGDRFTGNCIWGVGKGWGSLTFIHAPLFGVEVIRRVGKSSRTDD